jgi:hypothetical protein
VAVKSGVGRDRDVIFILFEYLAMLRVAYLGILYRAYGIFMHFVPVDSMVCRVVSLKTVYLFVFIYLFYACRCSLKHVLCNPTG